MSNSSANLSNKETPRSSTRSKAFLICSADTSAAKASFCSAVKSKLVIVEPGFFKVRLVITAVVISA